MHGFSSCSTFRVNAEVDSMGVVVDGGVISGTKPSPRRAEIEKAQAELRLEYDVREERRRELEFLEKGGDPLDFKLSHAASVSVQSTSHTNQHPDHILTSEAKGSFALTPSPRRDSVESSGRLRVPTACEPNSADNFDGENEMLQSDRKSIHPVRKNITSSEHSSQIDRGQNVKGIQDSPIFHPKKGQLYRRRNRSKPNCEHSRSNSADMTTHGGNSSSMPDRHVILSQPVAPVSRLEMESDGTHGTHSMTSEVIKFVDGKLDSSNSKEKLEEVENPRLKADEALVTNRTVEPTIAVGRDSVVTLDADLPATSGAVKIAHVATSAELNETSKVNGANCPPTDAPVSAAPVMTKGIESESSCSQTFVSVNGNENVDSDLLTNLKNVDNIHSNGAPKEPTLPVRESSVSVDHKMLSEDHVTNATDIACIKEVQSSMGHQGYESIKEDPSNVDRGESSHQENVPYAEGQKKRDDTEIKSEKELDQFDDHVAKMESSCPVSLHVEPASEKLNKNGSSGQPPVLEIQPGTQNQPRPQDSAQEERILEEAQMIVAKRKRIAAVSIGPSPKEHRHKCHWDLVLEEMAWLANDFAQERLWKLAAAAQTCRQVAIASRKRLLEESRFSKQKSVAHTLGKAVMDFWYSASVSVENDEKCNHEASPGGNEKDKESQDDFESTRKKQDHGVWGYAVRFLQFNCQLKPLVDVEVPSITDLACDVDNGLPELSWQDQFTEENLFYTVAPGATEMYRKSVEACLADFERLGNNTPEEVISSTRGAAAECGYEHTDYEEGAHLYYQPGALDTKKPSKKKLKKMKSYVAGSYDLGGDFDNGNCGEIRNGTVQLNVMGKRHASNLSVDPVPMKRVRTASRQRVVGPFSAGTVGASPVLSRADASSEDTNSFQDDKNTLHGGSVVATGLEVDSAMNFEKQSTLDSAEMSAKHKKNKKTKHQSLSYDHRWPLDCSVQDDQKDLVRKRSDNHYLEANGNGGLFGQHAKKPKLAKHSVDNSFDYAAPRSGSVPSPVASQMSNLSSQTKLIKLIGGRDRGKKGKGLKMSTRKFGSGTPWTTVEDQALVVLVHDMGPNWELVSDAINNILQFKCIFRKPQECKEQHRYLMDTPSGDAADSGEDSGSSQPYPSTLPGIPKGSARQLFQSLHAHVEEDNIKSRFEKIIRIEQQLYFRKKKNDNQELKHIVPAHGSHILSLTQVMPNNMNGGVLTPLDLCDSSTSNQDPFSIGNQTSHAGGLPLPHQSSVSVMHSPSGLSSAHQSLQGSPSMAVGNNLASPPSQFTSARDARYTVPRSGSLPVEEHQRLHQYNSGLQGRNIQASNLSSSGSLSGSDRAARMHANGNGVNVMPGMNRSIPMVRPGAQGIPSSPTLNSASVLSSNMGGVPSNSNMHGSASGRGNGNTVFRPRDSLHGVQSVQSAEHQRQMISAGMQMHATQTNCPGVAPFGGLSSGFSNNQATSPLQTYPGYNHPHSAIPEQQALSRMSRERQMHKRLSQHKHQQHPTSSALLTRPQTPSLPMSSPSSSPSVPSPIIHVVQPTNAQGFGRNAQCGPGGMKSQGGKQRQQSKSQQDPKRLKVIGKNNMIMHQNLPTDPSQLNGPSSANLASQGVEEGESAMHVMQDQILYSGSTLNTLPTSKPVVGNATSNLTQPQKPCVNKGPATSKPLVDGGNQGKALGSNKGLSKTVVLSRNRQQLQGQHSLKMVNQTQSAIQRKSQQNRQMNSDYLTTSSTDRSLPELKSASMGPPPACVESVCDEFPQPGSTTSQAVTNPSGVEPLLSVNQDNNLVSRQLEAQRHQQESQLSPLQPILPQKQSHIKFDQSAV